MNNLSSLVEVIPLRPIHSYCRVYVQYLETHLLVDKKKFFIHGKHSKQVLFNKEVLMENLIRIIAAGIMVFLLYVLFFVEDSSAFTPFIMIASASGFILYFISWKYFSKERD